MDIYVKELDKDPILINAPGSNNNARPFFMMQEEVDLVKWNIDNLGMDAICWEGEIISQMWENKYGWFDFSKNMIDIGGGAGEYPTFLNFKHSYIFEPNKEKQYLIGANLLSYDKVYSSDIIPYALSDNPGTRTFNGWSENDEDTHQCRDESNKQIVEFRTLDSFNLENIGFIKVDIEGFEYNALHSGIGTIVGNNFPPILTEIWDVGWIKNTYDKETADFYINNQRKLFNMLQTLGYVKIEGFGNFQTFFFIHHDQLNGYTFPKES